MYAMMTSVLLNAPETCKGHLECPIELQNSFFKKQLYSSPIFFFVILEQVDSFQIYY